MDVSIALICFALGLVLGAMLVWLFLRARFAEEKAAQVRMLEAHAEQRLEDLRKAQSKVSESFSALSAEALRQNNASFMAMSQGVVQPLRESLDKVDGKIRELEATREGAYRALFEQVASLVDSQGKLRQEAENLSRALHAPTVRGRWGEIQLRRVVELSGMVQHCDFDEQSSVTSDDRQGRPDLVVRLPGDKCIVVDSKAPLSAYLQAADMPDDDQRKMLMKEHADQVRRHVMALSKKSYFKHFDQSPEFVVLFLPGEIFFSAALSIDPGLIEAGVENGVIIATPTTLIALLRAVAFGWRQETLAQNAQKISQLAHKLYERLVGMSDHFHKVGKGLRGAVESYNQAIGTLESRVLVTARKITDLGGMPPEKGAKLLEPIETTPRVLQASELQNDPSEAI